MEASTIGKSLVIFGSVLLVVGLFFMFSDRLPFMRVLGRLPGDLSWRGEGWQFHAPIATSLVLSLLLSVALWIFAWVSHRGGH